MKGYGQFCAIAQAAEVLTERWTPLLPAGRTVIHFRFPGAPKELRFFWLVLPEADLCLSDPGFGVDITVSTDPKTLTAAWMGDLGLAAAVSSRDIELEGSRQLVRSFPKWFGLHPLFASVDHPTSGRGSPLSERAELQGRAVAIARQEDSSLDYSLADSARTSGEPEVVQLPATDPHMPLTCEAFRELRGWYPNCAGLQEIIGHLASADTPSPDEPRDG